MLAGRNNTTTTAGRRVWHLEYGRPLVHWIFKEKKKLSKLEKKWREKNPSPLGTQRISSCLIGCNGTLI